MICCTPLNVREGFCSRHTSNHLQPHCSHYADDLSTLVRCDAVAAAQSRLRLWARMLLVSRIHALLSDTAQAQKCTPVS
jgi:hypothetical protein